MNRVPQAHTRVTLIEWLWMAVAVGIPVYRTLPPAVGQLWTLGTMGLVLVSAILGRTARPAYPALWILSGYCIVASSLTSVDEFGDFTENLFVGGQLLVLLGLAPFVLAQAVRIPLFLSRVATAFLIAQTLSATAGILQVAGLSVSEASVVNGRAPGLAGHPNVLGIMSSIALILVLNEALRGKRSRSMLAALALLNLGGLLATGSLSSMLAALVGLAIAAVALRVRTRQVLWSVGIAIGTFLLALNFTEFGEKLNSPTDRFLQVTGQTEAVSTLDIRGDTYQFAWDHITSSPLIGVGLNSHSAASFDNATVVHNVFLRSWYQGGALLALAIGLIILAAVVVAIRAVTFGTNGAAAGVMAAVIVFALTSAFFEQAYYWLPVLLAFAAVGSGPRLQLKVPAPDRSARQLVRHSASQPGGGRLDTSASEASG